MTQPDSRPDAPALEPESAHHPDLPRRFGRKFQLGIDQAAPADIDARIRDSVELTGTTPWILMSAILIASIGLNVTLSSHHDQMDFGFVANTAAIEDVSALAEHTLQAYRELKKAAASAQSA